MMKIIATILVFALMVSVFVACNNSSNDVILTSTESSSEVENKDQDVSVVDADTIESVTNEESSAKDALLHGVGAVGIVNARELGGYPTLDGTKVKPQTLIRSGQLTNATDEDIKLLQNDYNLKTIIDLRGPITIEKEPDPSIEGINIYTYDLSGQETQQLQAASQNAKSGENSNQNSESAADTAQYKNSFLLGAVALNSRGINVKDYFFKMYADLVTSDYAIEGIKGVFEVLLTANENESVLWHCTSGKDRTGVVSALVLTTLNVDKEIILEDYELTNTFSADEIEKQIAEARMETDDEHLLDEARIMLSVDRAYLEQSFRTIDEIHGGMDNFIHNIIGLSEDDITILRAKYTV